MLISYQNLANTRQCINIALSQNRLLMERRGVYILHAFDAKFGGNLYIYLWKYWNKKGGPLTITAINQRILD